MHVYGRVTDEEVDETDGNPLHMEVTDGSSSKVTLWAFTCLLDLPSWLCFRLALSVCCYCG